MNYVKLKLNKFNVSTLRFLNITINLAIKCNDCDESIIIQMAYSNRQESEDLWNGRQGRRVMWGRCVKEPVRPEAYQLWFNLETERVKLRNTTFKDLKHICDYSKYRTRTQHMRKNIEKGGSRDFKMVLTRWRTHWMY